MAVSYHGNIALANQMYSGYIFWLYIICVFLWCMGNTYSVILVLYLEYQNMSQNHKNGQTTQMPMSKRADCYELNIHVGSATLNSGGNDIIDFVILICIDIMATT